MRYYIADCHFYHESLNIQMDNRGFSSGEEMNAYMLKQWNGRVRDKDEVVILGDLSLGKQEETNALLDELKGRLYLVRGNHDYFGRNRHYRTDRFEWIRDYAELKDNHRKLIVCHYPIMFYNCQYQYRLPKTGGLDQLADDGTDPGESAEPRERQSAHAQDRDSLPLTTWMLYGHVHNTVDEQLMRRFVAQTRETTRQDRTGGTYHIPCQMINCFCMFSDYVPLTLDEWIENDRRRWEQIGGTV